MATTPSLEELCQRVMAKLVNQDAEKRKELFSLPLDLLGKIIPLLSPLALESLQNEAGCKFWFTESCGNSHGGEHHRGVKRCLDVMMHGSSFCCLNGAWKQQFDKRWPIGLKQLRYDTLLSPSEVELLNLHKDKASIDWRHRFWEAHVQECLNEAVEQASISLLEGSLGNMTLSHRLLRMIGCEFANSEAETSLICGLKYNCWHFGKHVRYLRLRGALCTRELSNLLSSCTELRHVVCSHVATAIQVEGLCLFLRQNRERLQVLEFQHCRFSEDGLLKIHDSLSVDGKDPCLLQHLLVHSSNTLFSTNAVSLLFMRFLHACRYLRSLVLIESQVSPITASKLFSTISSGVLHLSLFHLQENELKGFSAPSAQKMLQNTISTSLKALDMRSNDIHAQDIKDFLPFFNCVPLLERMDLSHNPLGDEGVIALLPVLHVLRLSELSLSACNISIKAACCLLDLLISLKCSLRSLNLSHNYLGSSMAAPLANVLQHGVVERLDIGDIGLGTSGCLDLQNALQEMPNLTHLIIRKNRVGSAGAGLLCKLVAMPNSLKVIDFSSNLLDLHCLQSVASQLQVQSTVKGGMLQLVDLRYNLAEDFQVFKNIKKPEVLLSGVERVYDDDP
eukprot:c21146_g1_i2 orf=57-1916(+)